MPPRAPPRSRGHDCRLTRCPAARAHSLLVASRPQAPAGLSRKMGACRRKALTLLSSVFAVCGLGLLGIAVSTDHWLYTWRRAWSCPRTRAPRPRCPCTQACGGSASSQVRAPRAWDSPAPREEQPPSHTPWGSDVPAGRRLVTADDAHELWACSLQWPGSTPSSRPESPCPLGQVLSPPGPGSSHLEDARGPAVATPPTPG